ncbi:RNA methylase [Cryptosporidium ubiquitum]|uniref:tRNA (adenine(58)-N(1))-methyltransferase non-catalytic subunit TRM6 n=1 Tax=Cryptosporidium ubiquitum TaxID=857276 RepID=A0A1J4MR82_9CRYT|nr:RNA methylase [Cryptosporidium ubiquitum]OII75405.1 RNA methylase [Cryptosporidium ubiquitum]
MIGNVINLGDYVVIREVTGSQKLIHIKENSQNFFLGKYSIKGSDIIGKSYYSTLSLEDGRWVIGSILNSEEILKDILNTETLTENNQADEEQSLNSVQEFKRKRTRYNQLLGREVEVDSDDSNHENEPLDERDELEKVKRKRNEILLLNKANDSNLIRSLALSSSSFKNKTNFSKEKYIKKLQLRYLKHITLLPCTLLNIIETSSCQPKIRSDKLSPNSVGPRWGQCTVRIETIGNILTHGNVFSESKVLLYDNLSNGVVGGSIYRQLCNIGSLYEISMNRLTFDTFDGYFHGKLPINFEAIVNDRKTKTHYHTIPISALEIFYKEMEKLPDELFEQDQDLLIEKLDIQHEWLNYKINTHSKGDLSDEKSQNKKKRVYNRISILENLYSEGVDTVILVIDQVKWQTTTNLQNDKKQNSIGNGDKGNNNINNNEKKVHEDNDEFSHTSYEKTMYFDMEKMIQVTQEYLKPGGKLLIFTPFMTTELLQIHQDLSLSTRVENSKFHPFIGIKLEETFIREHQIIDQRTHPTMDANLPIFSGFLLSAIHIS